jgi:light-regulated signal transduction histidine kinase (bacteriophytochrome)
MRQAEAQLLSARLAKAAASTRRMKILIAVGNSLAILILLMKGFVIHWETRGRNLAEQNLKESNERLERRTAELSETNIELESFAYSVAHDLRAPLRHIAGYSGVLTQDYGPRLDAEGLRCLGKITECARQMGRLVDDLLNLSRIGRQELAFQDIALSSLVAHAIEDIAPELAGRNIEWRIGELFSAECDPGLMKQVFINLLSNSVKYTRRREPALIEVGQTMQNGERIVFVRDNGVGFEMQYAEKLFGVFQRLHKARDFEGTGVGLAIVQRIIRKHGGRIWAEAAVDQGATFFFALGTPEIKVREQPEPAIHEEEIHVARS